MQLQKKTDDPTDTPKSGKVASAGTGGGKKRGGDNGEGEEGAKDKQQLLNAIAALPMPARKRNKKEAPKQKYDDNHDSDPDSCSYPEG